MISKKEKLAKVWGVGGDYPGKNCSIQKKKKKKKRKKKKRKKKKTHPIVRNLLVGVGFVRNRGRTRLNLKY